MINVREKHLSYLILFSPLLKSIRYFCLFKNLPSHTTLTRESWDSNLGTVNFKSHADCEGFFCWSELFCSLSLIHLPTSSLALVNPYRNSVVCSAPQTSLLFLVSDPLPGTHFPSTFLEYFSR